MKAGMSGAPTKSTTRVRDLVRLLDQMRSLYEQMFTVIDAKLSAMRRSDVAAMAHSGAQERVLSVRLGEREGLR